MRKKSKVTGLKGAEAIVKELSAVIGADMGAQYLSDEPRRPTFGGSKAPSHEQVLYYLALEGRSLYPSDDDGTKAGKIMMDEIAKHLKRTARKTPDGKPVATDKKQMLAGGVAGLQGAAKSFALEMYKRAKSQRTTSGAGAEKVTETYAKRREARYSVGQSTVYKASGQLLDALKSGKVKIFIKGLPK